MAFETYVAGSLIRTKLELMSAIKGEGVMVKVEQYNKLEKIVYSPFYLRMLDDRKLYFAKRIDTKRKRKFAKGCNFISVTEFNEWTLSGRWVYYNHKPMHPSWVRNWSLSSIICAINQNRLSKAEEN